MRCDEGGDSPRGLDRQSPHSANDPRDRDGDNRDGRDNTGRPPASTAVARALDQHPRTIVPASSAAVVAAVVAESSGRRAGAPSVANICFGGPKRNRLFICATTSLYAIYLAVRGATRPTP